VEGSIETVMFGKKKTGLAGRRKKGGGAVATGQSRERKGGSAPQK